LPQNRLQTTTSKYREAIKDVYPEATGRRA